MFTPQKRLRLSETREDKLKQEKKSWGGDGKNSRRICFFNEENEELSFKISFSGGISGFGIRSSMIFRYEALTEITNSEEKGKEAEQLAVVTPERSQSPLRVRGA